MKPIYWSDLTGLEHAGELEEIRCWLRQCLLDRTPIESMFRLMLEPYFNPGKRLAARVGHAVYWLGKLVPKSEARNITAGGLVSLESWMIAWAMMLPKGEESLPPIVGEPPQLPCISPLTTAAES